MIVRDEEAVLAQFLEAADGLWDELCVVDTGSIDNTTQILRMAGARVQSVLWNDNFAEARNVCLEMASSDWIIVLDADELVSAALVQSARAQLERCDRGACVLPFVSDAEGGALQRTNILRMFHRHPSLRYRFRLHEDITSAVETYLTRTQLGVGQLAGHVDHLGARPDRQVVKAIAARDEALWRRTLNDAPSDVQGWYERLRHSQRWQSGAAAAALAQAAYDVLLTRPDDEWHVAGSMVGPLLLLVAQCTAHSDRDAAITMLDEAQTRLGGSAHFYAVRAQLLVEADRPAAAAADFERALGLSHTSYDVHATCIRPLVGLAQLYHQQNEPNKAQALLARALSFDARDCEALGALARMSTTSSGASGLEAAALTYIARFGDCPERQTIFSKHAERLAQS